MPITISDQSKSRLGTPVKDTIAKHGYALCLNKTSQHVFLLSKPIFVTTNKFIATRLSAHVALAIGESFEYIADEVDNFYSLFDGEVTIAND